MTSLELTFGDTLAFVLLIGALVVMPGIGALRLLGVRAPSPTVALALGSSTGLVLCCSVGFLGARVSWWTIPLVLVPLALVGWVRGEPISDRGIDRGDVLILGTIVVGLIGLSPWWIIRGEAQDGLIPVYPYVDQFLHTGTIIEIMRGFPPEQMPHVAGIPFWQYHLFTDLFASTMVALGNLAVLPAQGALVPAFGWAICLLAIAALAYTLTAHAGLSALAVALFLSPELSDTFTLDWLQRNTPSQLALPVSLCAVLLMVRRLTRHDDNAEPERHIVPELVLIGGLVAGVFALKAQQFLMIAPALGALGLVLLKDGRLKAVVLGVLSGTIVIAAPLVHHLTHPEPRPLAWKPGAFAGWLAADQIKDWAPGFLDSAGPAIGTAVLVLVWFATGAGLLFTALSLLSLKPLAARLRPGATVVVVSAFAVATFFTCYGPVEDGTRQFEAWNVGFFTRLLTTPLLCAFAMLGLLVIGRAIAARTALGERLGALQLVIPALVMVFVALGRLGSGPLDQPAGFPLAWVGATGAIAENAPDDAVVADVSHLYTGCYLSTFAGRRVVIERAIQFGAHYRQVAERVGDLELAWSDPDPRHVRWIFDRYKVTHVIEHRAAPLALPLEQREGWSLKLDGEVRVWERPVGARTGVPAGLQSRRVEATNRHRAVIRVHQMVDLETVLRDAQTDLDTLKQWNALARAPYGPRSPTTLAAPIPAATEADLPPELRPADVEQQIAPERGSAP